MVIDWLLDHTPSARSLFLANLLHLTFWVAMILPTLLWLRDSVPYLVLISVWALVASNFAAVTASMADLAAQQPPTQGGGVAP